MDSITELNNLNYIVKILPEVLESRNIKKYLVIILDVDNFKHINNTIGYRLGNKVLNEIGKRLTNSLADEIIVSYLGSARFSIIAFENIVVHSYIENIQKVLKKAFIIDNHKVSFTVSIGVYVNENNSIHVALEKADMALIDAKDKGKDCAVYYTEMLKGRFLRKSRIIEKLKYALDNNILDVYYQPKIRLKDEQVIGFEALVRWIDEDYGYISPSEFIPLAEQSDIILWLGRYVIKKVCEQIKDWPGSEFKGISVAINLSAKQFKDISLPLYIFKLLQQYELPSEILEFEITETTIIKDIEHSNSLLNHFQQNGIKIAIDDFGTGFSSYKYLSEMNFNIIKIDKSFIDYINIDSKKNLIVKNIIDFAHIIGSEVVAEGVEQEQQVTVLKKHECDMIQGFYYSKPMPIKELDLYLRSKISKA